MRRVAVLLAFLLAGCASPEPEPADTPAATTTSTGPLPPGNLTPAEVVRNDALLTTLYFTEDGRLVPDLPDEGRVEVGSPSTLLVTGPDFPVWTGDPLVEPLLFANADVYATIFLQSSLPQTSNGGFDVGIWAGSTQAYAVEYFGGYAPFTAPGQVQEVRLTLSFAERRSLFIPVGEALQVMFTGPMGRETGEPHMLIGGQTASRITVLLANYTGDPMADVTGMSSETLNGELTGSVAFFCPPVVIPAPHDIAIDMDAQWARITVAASPATYDIDLTLTDEGGTILAHAFSPLSEESVYLAAEALDGLRGKTLRLQVTPCGYGPATYSGTFEQGLRPE